MHDNPGLKLDAAFEKTLTPVPAQTRARQIERLVWKFLTLENNISLDSYLCT
jgi:hypothetical protein